MLYRKTELRVCVCVCLREIQSSQLTFDCGDDGSSFTEDVHRVEALVFADNGLQDSQQLPKTLMDRLMKAILVLCKVKKCNFIVTEYTYVP